MAIHHLQHTLESLGRMLKLAQRVSPVALKAVVGTKADLNDERKVASQDAVVSQPLSLFLSLCTLTGIYICTFDLVCHKGVLS